MGQSTSKSMQPVVLSLGEEKIRLIRLALVMMSTLLTKSDIP